MKKRMIFALLLAGGLFGMANSANAQAFCGTNCGGGALSCSGSECSAVAGTSVSCKNNGKWTTTNCPKVVADV